MRRSEVIKSEPAKTDAQSFLNALASSNQRWSPSPHAWIFRGHSDHTYELLPSSLRSTCVWLGYSLATQEGRMGNVEEQIKAEYNVLRMFHYYADAYGLSLPEDDQTLRTPEGWEDKIKPIMRKAADGQAQWPPTELYSLTALAQHYGVPTRLLDWTEHAGTAAYFASSTATRWVKGWNVNRNAATHICVWALSLEFVYRYWSAELISRMTRNLPNWGHADVHTFLRVVSAPRATNPNMFAQSGIFTHSSVLGKLDNDIDHFMAPIDEVIWKHALHLGDQWFVDNNISFPLMRRIRMPIAETPKLLRLLNESGINAASIYPGYKGAVSGLEERRLWDADDIWG